MIRIMTWNIQNGGTKDFNCPQIDNIENILTTIKGKDPDIIVLQEYQSKYHDNLIGNDGNKISYKYTVCQDCKDAVLRNRVLIASKIPFKTCEKPKELEQYSKRNWNEIFFEEYNFHVLGVDVPLAEITTKYGKKNNMKQKKTFLNALDKKFNEYKNMKGPAIILGDFNLHSKSSCSEYIKIFKEKLHEVTNLDNTWRKYKLDYMFVNDSLLKKLSNNKSVPKETEYSDHKYLYLDIDNL